MHVAHIKNKPTKMELDCTLSGVYIYIQSKCHLLFGICIQKGNKSYFNVELFVVEKYRSWWR